MNILKTDFRMLIWNDSFENEKVCRQARTNNMVVSGKAGRYRSWQIFSPSGDTLYATNAKSNIADPVIITFAEYSNGFPLKITIENPVINMKLSLKKLTQ